MPSTDTSDLSVTSMGLLWQQLGAPSLGDSTETLTLGNTDDVNETSGGEHVADADFLLEELDSEVNLLGDLASVDLDLDHVGLLLVHILGELWLVMADGSDHGAVLFHSGELDLELGVAEAAHVLGEGFLLTVVPVSVEPSLELVAEGAGPGGGHGSESLWGVDVADQTDNLHWWGLDDGDSLKSLLVVEDGVLVSLDLSHDVGHASLESGEGSEVWLLGGVILREASDTASMMPGSLSWQETEMASSWTFELSV